MVHGVRVHDVMVHPVHVRIQQQHVRELHGTNGVSCVCNQTNSSKALGFPKTGQKTRQFPGKKVAKKVRAVGPYDPSDLTVRPVSAPARRLRRDSRKPV